MNAAEYLAAAIVDAMPVPRSGSYRGVVTRIDGGTVPTGVWVNIEDDGIGEVRCLSWSDSFGVLAEGRTETVGVSATRGVGRWVLVQFVEWQAIVVCAIVMGI